MTAHTLGSEAQRQYGAASNGGPVQLSHYGRYADRVEKRDGIWRIAHHVVIFEAMRFMPGEVPPIKPTWSAHRRNMSDPIFKLRAEAGIAWKPVGVWTWCFRRWNLPPIGAEKWL